MKLKQILLDPRLQAIFFQEDLPIDETEPVVDFGYLAPQLQRQVFQQRVKEAFIEWLKAYERDVESKAEKKLAQRLQLAQSLEELEQALFCGPVSFEGKQLSSLRDTVIGESYQFIFRREKSDMQLPSRLSDECLDCFVEDLFYSGLDDDDFLSIKSLLRKLVDTQYLSRSLATSELDTLLLYLLGFISSEVRRGQLHSCLESVYQFLLESGLFSSDFSRLIQSIYQAPSQIIEFEEACEASSRQLNDDIVFYKQMFTEEGEQREREFRNIGIPKGSQHSLEGMFQAMPGFEELKDKLLPPSQPQEEKPNDLERARERLEDSKLLFQTYQNKIVETKHSYFENLRLLFGAIPTALRKRKRFPALIQLEMSIATERPGVFEIAKVLDTPECRSEMEVLRTYTTRFSLKPLELLFFLRHDELKAHSQSRFDTLSMAYIAVLYNLVRVEFFVGIQSSLNRFFAAQYQRDDYPARYIDLNNVLRALVELEPSLSPLVDESILSIRRSRHVIGSYKLGIDEVITLLRALLLVAEGFFEAEEGCFVYIREGKAFLNTSLHSLVFLVCELRAKVFVEKVRSGLVSTPDLFKVVFEHLHFEHGIRRGEESYGLLANLKSVMGFQGRSLVTKTLTPKELWDNQNGSQKAAYYLHPSKRWRVWGNALLKLTVYCLKALGRGSKAVLLFFFAQASKIYSYNLLSRLRNLWRKFWKSSFGSFVKFLFLLTFIFLLYDNWGILLSLWNKLWATQ